MTRGFWQLRKKLEAGDMPAALTIVQEINRRVGPHIEFEERVFYPLLRDVLGDEYVDRLYREHRIGKRIIEEVLALEEAGTLDDDHLQDLLERTKLTLDHAVSCGTLLSHVDALAAKRQEELLRSLMRCRDRGRLWSELGGNGD